MKTLVTPVGLVDVMTLEFVEVADDVTREDVLAPSANDKHTRAAVLILEMLASGRQPSAKVKAAGVAQGLSDRTMKRAAAELEVVVEDETTATGRVTYWSLPGGVGPTSTSEIWPDPPSPHEHDDSRGSGQTGTGRAWPDLECPHHGGFHRVTSRVGALVFLACGCFLNEGNK